MIKIYIIPLMLKDDVTLKKNCNLIWKHNLNKSTHISLNL